MELGNTAKTDFIKNLVMLNETDEIVIVDTNQTTSCPGLFAPGDVTDTPFKQASPRCAILKFWFPLLVPGTCRCFSGRAEQSYCYSTCYQSTYECKYFRFHICCKY
jgi:hypothetical protein